VLGTAFGILEVTMMRRASAHSRRPAAAGTTASRPSGRRPSSGKAAAARARLGPTPADLVIVSRALADLAEYLQPRQESAGRGRVILDRRVVERRRAERTVRDDRRQSDRRQPPPDPAEALMRVLGFMVIPPGASSAAAPRRATRGPRSHRA